MFGGKSMSGVRDLTFGGLTQRLRRLTQKQVSSTDFAFSEVVQTAARAVGLTNVSESGIPDADWWVRLCRACSEKTCSPDGASLLHHKLVNALAQRLAVEEAFRTNGHEIEKETVSDPFVVMGLPRSGGHFVSHVFARSGLFLAPRVRDTWSPSLVSESERSRVFAKNRFAQHVARNKDFRCVRWVDGEIVDDDLTLSLQVPFSYAWGLLHGLDEYLLASIQEDQTRVFEHLKRTLQLFQWYRKCGHFSDCVPTDFNTIDNPIEIQQSGPKLTLTRMPWLIYSPLAILNANALHSVFPDMNIIWIHRALAQCVPSLCSSLALHNSLYTGKKPSETTLAQIGEKVLGMFGSGSELAIDYLATFPKEKMVHFSNRDANRHCTRLMMKTMEHFKLEIDRHRRVQGINGQTEFQGIARPLHDSTLQYFGLHEGVVNHVFSAYIHQFEEFAFEKRFGLTLQEYQPLAKANYEQRLAKSSEGSSQTIGDGQPSAGHFLSAGGVK